MTSLEFGPRFLEFEHGYIEFKSSYFEFGSRAAKERESELMYSCNSAMKWIFDQMEEFIAFGLSSEPSFLELESLFLELEPSFLKFRTSEFELRC